MFDDVLDYFRLILDGLDLNEWRTTFSTDNIPSTILDNSYHLSPGRILGGPASHQVFKFDYPVTLSVFLKGYRDERESVDAAISLGQTILCEFLKSENRLGANIKDIVPNALSILPLSESNDNSVMIEIELTARLFINFN